MRREHVAEIGSRGRAQPRGAGSLALRAGLRLVGNYRGPSSLHVLCRMAALPCTDDSRRSAAGPIGHRSTRSYCGGGPGPCDRGDSAKPEPASRMVLTHPTMAEGVGSLLANVPPMSTQR